MTKKKKDKITRKETKKGEKKNSQFYIDTFLTRPVLASTIVGRLSA